MLFPLLSRKYASPLANQGFGPIGLEAPTFATRKYPAEIELEMIRKREGV